MVQVEVDVVACVPGELGA